MPKEKIPHEDEEQKRLAVYLNDRFGYYGWVHVPNQRWAKVQYLRKLKLMGVKAGFPDILIFEPVIVRFGPPTKPIIFHGTALELKRQSGGVVNDEQSAWLDELEQRNMYPIVARGAEDAILQLEEVYGKWTK
jgi:hypothetical protein